MRKLAFINNITQKLAFQEPHNQALFHLFVFKNLWKAISSYFDRGAAVPNLTEVDYIVCNLRFFNQFRWRYMTRSECYLFSYISKKGVSFKTILDESSIRFVLSARMENWIGQILKLTLSEKITSKSHCKRFI